MYHEMLHTLERGNKNRKATRQELEEIAGCLRNSKEASVAGVEEDQERK